MQQYQNFIREQLSIQEKLKEMDAECVRCSKCKSQWFEEVAFQKFKTNHQVILGQRVPPKNGGMEYYLLRCCKCGEFIEPHIIHNTRSLNGDEYDNLLDTIEGKNDPREEEKEEVKRQDNLVNELRTTIRGLVERLDLLEEKVALQKAAQEVEKVEVFQTKSKKNNKRK